MLNKNTDNIFFISDYFADAVEKSKNQEPIGYPPFYPNDENDDNFSSMSDYFAAAVKRNNNLGPIGYPESSEFENNDENDLDEE